MSEPARPSQVGEIHRRSESKGAACSADPRHVRLADREAERTLLRRMVDGLGIRLVTLGGNRHLLASNTSMSLTVDELRVMARVMHALDSPSRTR